MENLSFDYFISKEREGEIFNIPFSVPDNVESITISYSYKKEEGLTSKSCVDLGLLDNNGKFLGWSGSNKSSITVGEFSSTDGYFTLPIVKGKWAILVGAYKIKSEGLSVHYDVTFSEKHARFFFGELHCHSTVSDGTQSIYELGMLAKKKGLDFISVTDHNNYSQNYNLPKINGLTFIPGVEWTTYKGHMNFYGLNTPFENSIEVNNAEGMRKMIEYVKKNGGFVSVNHPKCPYCGYLWGDDSVYDFMEVWNGVMFPKSATGTIPFTQRNVLAIEKWTEELKKGRKIPAVGGSDFHRLKDQFAILGNPTNGVFAENMSSAALLDAISKGHLFVTKNMTSVRLNLTCGKKMMGDTVSKKQKTIHLEASQDSGVKFTLVTDKGEKEVQKGDIAVSDAMFAYVIAKKRNVIVALTNPIYFE